MTFMALNNSAVNRSTTLINNSINQTQLDSTVSFVRKARLAAFSGIKGMPKR